MANEASNVRKFLKDKCDLIALLVGFLVGAFMLSSFLSRNYQLYMKIRDEQKLTRDKIYVEDVRTVSINLDSSEEVIVMNKPALIEVKVETSSDLKKKIKINCNEQIVK